MVSPNGVVGSVDMSVAISVGRHKGNHGVAKRRLPSAVVSRIDDAAPVVIPRQPLVRRTGRTACKKTRGPIGRIIRVAVEVDQFQRRATAVGRRWPQAGVVVGEIDDRNSRRAHQCNSFAAVA